MDLALINSRSKSREWAGHTSPLPAPDFQWQILLGYVAVIGHVLRCEHVLESVSRCNPGFNSFRCFNGAAVLWCG